MTKKRNNTKPTSISQDQEPSYNNDMPSSSSRYYNSTEEESHELLRLRTNGSVPENSLDSLKIPKSLWWTTEYKVYMTIIVFGLLKMIYTTVELSSESHPSYVKYRHSLSKGWMFGRQMDNTDAQYGSFRNNIPALLLAMSVYMILSHVIRRISSSARIIFSCVFSFCFFGVLFGISILKIMIIISINYLVTKTFPKSLVSQIFVWIFGLVSLYLNHTYSGYTFASIHPSLDSLDTLNGLNMRWWITFNFTVLRMISFTMDQYWALKDNENHESKEDADQKEKLPEERLRIEQPLSLNEYNFVNYLCYITYAPLYLAGPIVTFNDFIHQFHRPCSTLTLKSTLIYGLRWFGVVLLMETMMHYIHVVAISKTKAWGDYTPLEISMVGFFSLKMIWLKLLIIWRFFRLWAMADGLLTVENMNRCMSNNYSAMGFWRSWHRSYNRWLIRYLYVPLGGSKYYIYNVWLVFTFVAIWHDISFTLLAWGWLICVFLLPELICTRIFNAKKWGSWKYYRHLCAFGGTLNILMMMIANLVGFAVGLDGVKEMLSKLLTTSEGGLFMVIVLGALFATVNIMFEIRETEKRRKGDKMRF